MRESRAGFAPPAFVTTVQGVVIGRNWRLTRRRSACNGRVMARSPVIQMQNWFMSNPQWWCGPLATGDPFWTDYAESLQDATGKSATARFNCLLFSFVGVVVVVVVVVVVAAAVAYGLRSGSPQS